MMVSKKRNYNILDNMKKLKSYKLYCLIFSQICKTKKERNEQNFCAVVRQIRSLVYFQVAYKHGENKDASNTKSCDQIGRWGCLSRTTCCLLNNYFWISLKILNSFFLYKMSGKNLVFRLLSNRKIPFFSHKRNSYLIVE